MNTVTGKNEFWSPNVDLQTLSSRLEINERTVSIEDNFCRQCSTMYNVTRDLQKDSHCSLYCVTIDQELGFIQHKIHLYTLVLTYQMI